LLRPDGRNLDPEQVWSLSEDDAYGLFVDFRWAKNAGTPYCPRCGSLEPYSVRRRRFRCSEAECRAEFSVTSGTVFANRKLSFKKIIMAIWEEITAAKGMAALHLSRKLNVQYKTAYGPAAEAPRGRRPPTRRDQASGRGADRRQICRRRAPQGQ
jgi:hypothetical protein